MKGRIGRAALPLAALGLWLVPSPGRAQDPATGGDPPPPAAEHPFVSGGVYAVEYAEDPRISPDGAWVAYVRRFADRARDRWHTEIVRVRADGSGREPLTSGPSDRTPRFSADGARLAYVAAGGGFHEIRVISLATRRRRELAAGSRPIGTIAWAPIGDRLAFLRHGSELDTLVHLYVADVSSGAVRRLTATGFEAAALDLDTPLAWVPDGSALLFPAGAGEPDLLEIPASGGAGRRITSRRGPDEDPAVSPDGRLVAYASADSGTGELRLHLIERTGSGLPRVLHGRDGLDVYAPAWSPDGREVFALVEREGAPRLVLVALDGSVRVLADGLGAGPVARMQSAAFSVSADSANPRFAATAIVRGSPGEIVVGGRRRSDTPRRVTWTNDRIDLDTVAVTRQIRIAPDLPARLYRPAERGGVAPEEGEAAPEARLPGLLVIHGGCGPGWIDGFDLELTALAAAGYAVLALDPDGRVEPVLAAADSLASRPDVAGERLFLLERSGDGTLARETLGRSDAFRRTVVHRPPGCGDGPDDAPPERGEAATEPDTTLAGASEPAGPLVIETPAHPFDEPPSAFVARLRRTLDRLGGSHPRSRGR